MTAINVVQGLAPTEVKYGTINIDEETSTYEISGITALTTTTIADQSTIVIVGSLGTAVYGTWVTLVAHTYMGTGHITRFEFKDETSSGSPSVPWGHYNMVTSPYIYLSYNLVLRNVSTSTDYIKIDSFNYITAKWLDGHIVWQPRPTMDFSYQTVLDEEYQIRVDWRIMRPLGTGDFWFYKSDNRIFTFTESRF